MAKKKKIDTRHLMHGVCPLNAIPVRLRPDEQQSLVSQMLFGETCIILEKKNKHWFKIQTQRCQSTGWVRAMQLHLIEERLFHKYTDKMGYALEICSPVLSDELSLPVVMGSALPCFDGISLQLGEHSLVYNGQAAVHGELEHSTELLVKLARRYLHSPEFQGGRTPFGIDASALVQLLFSFFDVSLPRWAHEQFPFGEPVDFVEQSKAGDVAFFQDEEGLIHHCGIVLGDQKILHVFGQVRIDKLDHFGIYHTGHFKYTHKLRLIKRIIP
jgi:hypothetical protein